MTSTTLSFTVPNDVQAGSTYARFRITTDGTIDFNDIGGAATDGEVESHQVTIGTESDWSDEPDTYGTDSTANNNGSDPVGASHTIIAGIHMGTTAPDSETEGTAGANADSDDTTDTDDEGGVTIPSITDQMGLQSVVVTAPVTNTTMNDATLVGWIDFDRDGVYDPTDESATVAAAIPGDGSVTSTTLSFT
ncbi:MAG: hypothetical protein GY715_01880, partial [Planctomycetes bacterium]|nr:hypothetical protein [Planctomycetota bacterium]